MKLLKSIPSRLVDLAKRAYREYPARTLSYVAAVVVFVGAQLGVVVDSASVLQALVYIAPILASGEFTHRKVTPV